MDGGKKRSRTRSRPQRVKQRGVLQKLVSRVERMRKRLTKPKAKNIKRRRIIAVPHGTSSSNPASTSTGVNLTTNITNPNNGVGPAVRSIQQQAPAAPQPPANPPRMPPPHPRPPARRPARPPAAPPTPAPAAPAVPKINPQANIDAIARLRALNEQKERALNEQKEQARLQEQARIFAERMLRAQLGPAYVPRGPINRGPPPAPAAPAVNLVDDTSMAASRLPQRAPTVRPPAPLAPAPAVAAPQPNVGFDPNSRSYLNYPSLHLAPQPAARLAEDIQYAQVGTFPRIVMPDGQILEDQYGYDDPAFAARIHQIRQGRQQRDQQRVHNAAEDQMQRELEHERKLVSQEVEMADAQARVHDAAEAQRIRELADRSAQLRNAEAQFALEQQADIDAQAARHAQMDEQYAREQLNQQAVIDAAEAQMKREKDDEVKAAEARFAGANEDDYNARQAAAVAEQKRLDDAQKAINDEVARNEAARLAGVAGVRQAQRIGDALNIARGPGPLEGRLPRSAFYQPEQKSEEKLPSNVIGKRVDDGPIFKDPTALSAIKPDGDTGATIANRLAMESSQDSQAVGVEPADMDLTTAAVQTASGKPKITELTDAQINETMKPFAGEGFVGTVAADQVKDLAHEVKLSDQMGFVMNTDPHTKPGQHWVAVFISWTNNKDHAPEIDYYDPFGDPPSKETIAQIKQLVAERGVPYMLKMKINKMVNQRANAVTCGYHAMRFLQDMFAGKSFKDATNFSISDAEQKARGVKLRGSGKERFGFI